MSEFVLPNSPEQSVPCASWCISPQVRATSLIRLGETERSGLAMAQHTDEPHLSRLGVPLGRHGPAWCACQRDTIYRLVGVVLNNLIGNPNPRLGWTQRTED